MIFLNVDTVLGWLADHGCRDPMRHVEAMLTVRDSAEHFAFPCYEHDIRGVW